MFQMSEEEEARERKRKRINFRFIKYGKKQEYLLHMGKGVSTCIPQISAARVIIHHCFIDNRARRNSIKNSLVRHRRVYAVICVAGEKGVNIILRRQKKRREEVKFIFSHATLHRHVIHFSLLYGEMKCTLEMK
jgi:hypothetical protein